MKNAYEFEANGKAWTTDYQTISLMREYQQADNLYMTSVVFNLGREFGRIAPAVDNEVKSLTA